MAAWWRRHRKDEDPTRVGMVSPPESPVEEPTTGEPNLEQVLEAATAVDWGGDPSRLSG